MPSPLLSILDLSIGTTGRPLSDALGDTVRLAEMADSLGFERFWVGENHNIGSLASSSPAVLMSTIAARTSRIRVGAGCVLLNNHAPLAIAETFKVLHTLYPRRIDLGLGRAPGGDPLTALALRQQRTLARPDEFIDRLAELLGFADGLPKEHPYHGVVAMPADATLPDRWVFGSSVQSGLTAALAGVRYGFAAHLAPTLDGAPDAMAAYRAGFEPTGSAPFPWTAVSLLVFCADSAARAADLADAYALAWSRHGSAQAGLIPTLAEAGGAADDPAFATARERVRSIAVIGTPAQVVGRLQELSADLRADELIITTGIHDPAERVRCFALIHENWTAVAVPPVTV
ncbi:MsnO8 family LLM class oxidoreductase [Luedemannella helvata]|uniref:LLM class flavin-dependent oxidoreductase n=1 Tax=Luedemannella helvata TaxID=349315 RepID=A0ABN2KVN0_9ACTN